MEGEQTISAVLQGIRALELMLTAADGEDIACFGLHCMALYARKHRLAYLSES